MSKDISKNGINLIKSFEGCSLKAYKAVPSEKYWTIGWGHYGADVKPNTTITKKQADTMLKNDLQAYVNAVNNPNYCPVTKKLNQNQFDALVSFCYNCGIGNLRYLCTDKSIQQIGKDMLLYNKSGGVVLKGLVKRRQAENELFNKFCPYKVKTTCKDVVVRKKPLPLKKTSIVEYLRLGAVVKIIAEKVVDGEKYGKIKRKQWIRLKNTKIV